MTRHGTRRDGDNWILEKDEMMGGRRLFFFVSASLSRQDGRDGVRGVEGGGKTATSLALMHV